MEFNSIYHKEQLSWSDGLWYGAWMLLVVMVLCYGMLLIKGRIQQQALIMVNERLSYYGTPDQKVKEQQVLAHKKTIDDVGLLLQNHKRALALFTFLDRWTLAGVSFSSLDLSLVENQVKLVGQASNMALISQQAKAFEEQKEVVKSISVLNTQATSNRASFVISLSLNPDMFNQTSLP